MPPWHKSLFPLTKDCRHALLPIKSIEKSKDEILGTTKVAESFSENEISIKRDIKTDKFLKEDKKNIILISSLDEDAQTGGGGTVIPKSCVKEIVQLKEGRNGEVYDEPTKH